MAPELCEASALFCFASGAGGGAALEFGEFVGWDAVVLTGETLVFGAAVLDLGGARGLVLFDRAAERGDLPWRRVDVPRGERGEGVVEELVHGRFLRQLHKSEPCTGPGVTGTATHP